MRKFYPENEVVIYDRSRNEVYPVKGYNEFDKNFKEEANKGAMLSSSKELAERVYCYMIFTSTEKDGRREAPSNRGYLVIKRS